MSYLTLCKVHTEQRDHPLWAVFNVVVPWRLMPNDLPPLNVVFQQMRVVSR